MSTLPAIIKIPKILTPTSIVMSGEFGIANFPRLTDLLAETLGCVEVYVEFSRQNADRYLLLTIIAKVTLLCQRCLQPMQYPIHQSLKFLLLKPGQQLQELDSEIDTIELQNEQIDLLTLIEDELLIAIPFAPKHDVGICPRST